MQAQREAKARQQSTMAALKETDAHYKFAMQVIEKRNKKIRELEAALEASQDKGARWAV